MNKVQKLLNIINEGVFKIGDRVGINIPLAVGKGFGSDKKSNIIKKMIKNGGDGKVEIISIDDHNKTADIAGWKGDALLGTVTVPIISLQK